MDILHRIVEKIRESKIEPDAIISVRISESDFEKLKETVTDFSGISLIEEDNIRNEAVIVVPDHTVPDGEIKIIERMEDNES